MYHVLGDLDYWPSITSTVNSEYEPKARVTDDISALLKDMNYKLNRMHELVHDKQTRVEFIRADIGRLRGDVDTIQYDLNNLRRRLTKPY